LDQNQGAQVLLGAELTRDRQPGGSLSFGDLVRTSEFGDVHVLLCMSWVSETSNKPCCHILLYRSHYFVYLKRE
jgi:hypothetical protein